METIATNALSQISLFHQLTSACYRRGEYDQKLYLTKWNKQQQKTDDSWDRAFDWWEQYHYSSAMSHDE